jgi:hypothetical protein
MAPDGAELTLQATDVSGELLGFQATARAGAADANVASGRYVNADGDEEFVLQSGMTFGAANAGPLVGPVVINELNYHPASDLATDEYLELYNITDQPVVLLDWFTTGVAYTFGDVSIPANGYMLLVGSDPASFLATHAVPAGVAVVGPYVGALDNAGEFIGLHRPGPVAMGVAIVVDHVDYSDSDPWDTAADGDGPSLARIDSTAYGNESMNWNPGTFGGTPGSENSFFDPTPPTVPTGLTSTIAAGPQIRLEWNASVDPDSAVGDYRVYRNGALVTTTPDTEYIDTNVTVGAAYSYQVVARNTSQIASGFSLAHSTGVMDITNVTVVDSTHLRVTFTSAVAAGTAQNPANYLIPKHQVTGAVAEASGTSVLLTTAPLVDWQSYRVVVNNVTGAAGQKMLPDRFRIVIPGSGPGLVGSYYNGINFDTHVYTRIDQVVDFIWATNSPNTATHTGVNNDMFSVRWLGRILPEFTDVYTIRTTTSDGIRVWIDADRDGAFEDIPSEWIINDWNIQASTKINNGLVNFIAGEYFPIKVEYFENTASATMLLRWARGQGTGIPVTSIPSNRLAPPGSPETTSPTVMSMHISASSWSPAFRAELEASGEATAEGVPVPVGGTSAVVPWSGIDTIRVAFDSDVAVAANQLSINGVNIASYGVESFTYDFATCTATWRLATPIDADRVTLTLAATVEDLSGNDLSGGRVGTLRVLPGDADGDEDVDNTDFFGNLVHQFTAIGHTGYDARNDFNADGAINAQDWLMARDRRGQSLPAPSPEASQGLALRASRQRLHRVAVDEVLGGNASEPAVETLTVRRPRRR